MTSESQRISWMAEQEGIPHFLAMHFIHAITILNLYISSLFSVSFINLLYSSMQWTEMAISQFLSAKCT